MNLTTGIRDVPGTLLASSPALVTFQTQSPGGPKIWFNHSLFSKCCNKARPFLKRVKLFCSSRHENCELISTATTSRPWATPDLLRIPPLIVKKEFQFWRKFQFREKTRDGTSDDFPAAHGQELITVHRNKPDDAENTFANFDYAFF